MRRPIRLLAALAAFHASSVFAASCTVGAVTLNFGAYVGSQVSVAQTISLTCSNTLPPPEQVRYDVRLSTGFSNSYGQRLMQRTSLPADTLPYNLYLGAVPAVLNTNVWGDGNAGTVFWQGSMTLSNGQPIRTDTNTIAGAVPAGVVPAGGAYIDTITAIVTFR